MILIDPDELVTAAETFSSRREPRTVTFAPVRAATWRDAICGVVTVVAPIDPRLCDPLNEIGGRMDAISAVARPRSSPTTGTRSTAMAPRPSAALCRGRTRPPARASPPST